MQRRKINMSEFNGTGIGNSCHSSIAQTSLHKMTQRLKDEILVDLGKPVLYMIFSIEPSARTTSKGI